MSATLTYDEYRSRRYIPALDGLRAISVLGVMTWHLRHSPLAFLHGGNGVWVFFVLSGYLITTLSLREEAKLGALRLKAFFTRRAFRILPLYYLVLAVYAVLILVLHVDARSHEFRHMVPYYLGYLQEYGLFRYQPAAGLPFGVTWTLGIEEKFYLVWPVLGFLIMAKSRWRLPVVVGLTTFFIVLDNARPWGYARFFAPYAIILMGCALAIVLHERAAYERLAAVVRPWMALALGVAVVGMSLVPLDESKAFLFSIPVVALLGVVVVLRGEHTTALSLRPLVWLGTVSYAFYLTHQIGLQMANRVVPVSMGRAGDIATYFLGLVVVIPACYVLHRWFEAPLIKVGRKLANRPARQPEVAVVPA